MPEGMNEFLWFVLGIFSYRIISGMLQYGQLAILFEEQLYHMLKLLDILSKDLDFMNKIFLDNINKKKTKFKSNFDEIAHSTLRHNFGHTFGTIGIKNSNNLIYDIELNQPMAIVMGSEEKGINPSTLKILDHVVKLPMYGDIASLNVSVACGAMLYETLRQRL